MMFNFNLKPPLKCAGLESPEIRENYICWFYLTDSEYFIELGDVKLFQNSPQWIEKYKNEGTSGVEFVDYQYSRQLEDFFDILPTIACPMPQRLYNSVNSVEKRDSLHDRLVDIWDEECAENASWSAIDDKYDNIIRNLLFYGNLDSGYLRFRSECQFVNVDGMMIIRYNFIDEDEDACPVWSAGKGIYTLPYQEFILEVENLLNRFFVAMDAQVENAKQIFREKAIKRSNLVSEHAKRKDYFYGILKAVKNNAYAKQIDWVKIESDLDAILNRLSG